MSTIKGLLPLPYSPSVFSHIPWCFRWQTRPLSNSFDLVQLRQDGGAGGEHLLLALEYVDMNGGDNPVLQPFQAVNELVKLAVISGLRSISRGAINPLGNIWRIGRRVISRWRKRMNRMTLRQEKEWIERGKNLALI